MSGSMMGAPPMPPQGGMAMPQGMPPMGQMRGGPPMPPQGGQGGPSMGAPPGPPGMGAVPPPPTPQQANLMMLARAAQQQQGARPGMPPGAPGMPPGAPGMPGPQGMPGAPPAGLNVAEAAKLGRNGDTLVAHLTPGEIEVPKEVQTPKVLASLRQAFHKAGVNENQFTAGSPQSSHNPQTGLPEYNFWSGLLGVLGGGAGALLAPELLPFLGAAAAPVTAGLGAAGGTMLGGGNSSQALMAGLGSAAGGAMFGAGGITGAATGADGAATSALAPTGGSAMAGAQGALGSSPTLNPLSAGASQSLAGSGGGFLGLSPGQLQSALAAAGGAGVGQQFGQPNAKPNTAQNSFNQGMGPINPNFNQLLGNSAANRPQFNGYNPLQSVSGGNPYNFFPQQ